MSNYKLEVKEILHDINNQLFKMQSYLYVNRDNLDVHYHRMNGLVQIMGKNVNNLSLISDESLEIKREKKLGLNISKLFQSLLSEIDDIYFPVLTDFDLIQTPATYFYNDLLFRQLILNIFDNSSKAKANMMKIDLKDKKDHIQISFEDNGKTYETKKESAYFTGVGKSVIQKICHFLNYEVLFKEGQNKFKVILKIKTIKN